MENTNQTVCTTDSERLLYARYMEGKNKMANISLNRYTTKDILNTDESQRNYLATVLEDYMKDVKSAFEAKPFEGQSDYLVSAYNHITRKDRRSCCQDCGYIEAGDIVYMDFGADSYLNEMGFVHFGLVLKIFNSKALIIPMTSNASDYEDAYDEIHNPFGKTHLMRLGKVEPLDKESTLFLNDLRYVSTARIIEVKGHLEVKEPLFEKIYQRVLETLQP